MSSAEFHSAYVVYDESRMDGIPSYDRFSWAAFYDESRNSSRVWHDVKVCGNPVNARASRARRRAGFGP